MSFMCHGLESAAYFFLLWVRCRIAAHCARKKQETGTGVTSTSRQNSAFVCIGACRLRRDAVEVAVGGPPARTAGSHSRCNGASERTGWGPPLVAARLASGAGPDGTWGPGSRKNRSCQIWPDLSPWVESRRSRRSVGRRYGSCLRPGRRSGFTGAPTPADARRGGGRPKPPPGRSSGR